MGVSQSNEGKSLLSSGCHHVDGSPAQGPVHVSRGARVAKVKVQKNAVSTLDLLCLACCFATDNDILLLAQGLAPYASWKAACSFCGARDAAPQHPRRK